MKKFIDDLYMAYSSHCERKHITAVSFTIFQEQLKSADLHISITKSKPSLNFNNRTPPPPESELDRFLEWACLITERPSDIVSKTELYRVYINFCVSRFSHPQPLDFVSFCDTIQAKPGIIPDPDLKFRYRGNLAFAGIRLVQSGSNYKPNPKRRKS